MEIVYYDREELSNENIMVESPALLYGRRMDLF